MFIPSLRSSIHGEWAAPENAEIVVWCGALVGSLLHVGGKGPFGRKVMGLKCRKTGNILGHRMAG
jgi:hypothetical protein